jgi:hypothetical protein
MIGATLSGAPFQWHLVLIKEYSAPLGWTLPIVGIGLYNMAQVADLDEQPGRMWTLLGVLAVVVAFWFVAAILKKTRSPILAAGR